MRKTRTLALATIVLVLGLALVACQPLLDLQSLIQATEEIPTATETTEAEAVPVVLSADLISQQDALISLYQTVSPGVVSIQVLTAEGWGTGSGFVLDKDGHIATNLHVVEDATYIEVAFSSGLRVEAEVIGTDEDSDLAIVKVDVPADELYPLQLGDSDALQVGQVVIAIGNPFGLNGTMTTGIVSALGRTLDSLNEAPSGQYFSAGDLIQTDAAINPGNSGGPLLNLEGKVIGINRAIRTYNFTDTNEPVSSGVGFAVPVNLLKRVAPALIEQGHYDYPYLGISAASEISLAFAEEYGLSQTTGVFLSDVTADGPADQAGLQVGDLIIRFDGQEVRQFSELITHLFNHTQPGDQVEVVYLRGEQEMTTTLQIEARP